MGIRYFTGWVPFCISACLISLITNLIQIKRTSEDSILLQGWTYFR